MGLIGLWSRRSLRAYLSVWCRVSTQILTGASRPNENRGSDWRPFDDNNGTSGHAFIGGVPFFTAAMMTENKLARYAWYGAGSLVGLSRFNDGKHYMSQVILGWVIAYESARTIADVEQNREITWRLLPLGDGAMLSMNARW